MISKDSKIYIAGHRGMVGSACWRALEKEGYTNLIGKTSKVKNLSLTSKDFKFCVELPIKANRKGYKLVNSKAHERSRIGGKKKVSPFKDGLIILIYLIKLFFVRN